jgi:hypothetical protein
MNVLETVNVLLDYYTPKFIEYPNIENNKLGCPYITYQINGIKYVITMRDLNVMFPEKLKYGNEIRLWIYSDIEANNSNAFIYKCNEIERLDILKKMDKVSKDWYKNYIEQIKVPIPNQNKLDPVIEMKGVEVSAPSDLV